MTCPFCSIIADNTEQILRQAEHTFTVCSNPSLMDGHLLVIPKKHVEKFSELSKEERIDLFEEAILLQEKILNTLSSGCDMSQHFRPFITQNDVKVNHLHIHLRPREFEDELYQKVQKYERDVFKRLQDGDVERIKKHLG